MLRRARERSGPGFFGPKRRLQTLLAGALVLAFVSLGGRAEGAASSPITVTKTPSASQVASGGQLTYTIVVTNTGGAALSNVSMTDQVNGIGVIQNPPALPQFTITSTKGACTQGGSNGNLITCNAGNMAGGESWTVTIGGQVTAGAGTTLNNTATVTGTKSATTFTTNSNATSVLVTQGAGGGLPDLTINKTGPTAVTTGAPMTYTLTVNNIGSANTSNVKVVDTLPSGVTLQPVSPTTPFTTTSLFNCSSNAPTDPITVTCSGGAVNAGQNGTVTINAIAPSAASGITSITNTAVVDPDNAIVESNELNNTSAKVNTSVGGTPPTALLDIKKTDGSPVPTSGPTGWWTGAGPDPVNPGQTLKYKILVTNNATGNNSVANYVSIVDSTQGLDASSIVATETLVNGTLAKTDGCVVAAPQIKCTAKALNSTGTITVTIVGTVVQSAGSSIFNTATVTGNVKNTGVTNTASEVTTVRPAVDLTITKDSSPNPVCARSWPIDGPPSDHLGRGPGLLPTGTGTPSSLVAPADCLKGLNYTFVVGNSGNGNATGVVVRDPLPAGEIFDSYDAPPDWSCDVLDPVTQIVTCSGPIPAASTKTLTFKVVAPPNLGSVTNTATVDPNNAVFESDETNNSVSVATSVVTGVDLVVWKGDKAGVKPPGSAPILDEGFDPVATNGTETYTIIVDNVGTQDATGIKVRDTLPAGTKFLSVTTDNNHSFTCSSDGSATGGNVTCIGGRLLGTESEFYSRPGGSPTPGDDFATIKIKIFVTPFVQLVGQLMHNVVRVDPDSEIPEADETNNLATQDTTVGAGNADMGAFNQLTIAKTQYSPAPLTAVATNGTLVYNLHVSNLGTDPVSTVAVRDWLPAGTRFISAQDITLAGTGGKFFCTQSGGIVNCTGGSFSGSLNVITGIPSERDIRITVFAPNTPGQITNQATVDPDNTVPEGNEFDNNSSVLTDVTVGGANMFNELTINKTQTDPTGNVVATSSVVTYHIDVSNAGTDPAFNVKVTDTLPAGFTLISALDLTGPTDPHDFVCTTGSGNTVNCTGATLSGLVSPAPGEPISRTIEVKATSSSVPGSYVNTALVDPDNTIPEGNETNNSSQAPTTVKVGTPQGFVDLQVTKTASPGTPGGGHANPGGQIAYTIIASNAGTDPAFNVKVQDTLPAGTTFESAIDNTPGPDSNRFTCGYSGGVVTCTGAAIDGSSGLAGVPTARSIFIVVDAPNKNVTALRNVVRIDPDNAIPESNETNNSAFAETDVISDINLTIDQSGPDSAHQNDSTQYVVNVHNLGSQPAKGVLVTDPLPIGLIPLGSVQATPGNFICQILENPVNVVSCVGDLNAAGDPNSFDSVAITIPVFITADGGTLDNQACVDPNNTIVESIETDNCSTNVTPILKKAPNLLINKSVDKTSVTAGDDVTYTLSLSNIGDGDATDPVTVTDTLPADATFVNSDPGAGVDCPAPVGGILTCTLAAGLTVGGSAQITVNMKVKSPLPATTTSITNNASVSAGTCSGVSGCESEAANPGRLLDNSASVSSSVGGSAIDLVMTNGPTFDSPDPVVAGQKLTYKLTVANNGSASTTTVGPHAVVIRTALPAGLDLASAAASGGFLCTPAGPTTGPVGNVDCTGDLAAGSSTIVTITTTVSASAGTALTATATVDPANAITESNEGNNSQTAVTSVVAAPCTACIDLVMGAIVATPFPDVTNGNNVTYNFTVTNIGDQPTSASPTPLPHDVVVTIDLDTIFNELTPVSVAAPGWTCGPTPGPILVTTPEYTCTIANVAAGAGTVFSVVGTANTGSVPSFVDFDVSVDPGNQVQEFNEANNTGTLRVNTN
jgi:uncharacterized repeat protein (TIGR01451 family)